MAVSDVTNAPRTAGALPALAATQPSASPTTNAFHSSSDSFTSTAASTSGAARTIPTRGEPQTATSASDDTDTSAAWQSVFGSSPGLHSSVSEANVDVSNKLPPGVLTANADGSITTPGGYTVFNDGGSQWRIEEPDGDMHTISGDPHVDENSDGTTDWHFNADSSFILPDGTKIFCDTDKVGSYGGGDVTVTDNLKIQYLDSLGSMDVAHGGPGTVTTGGLAYDASHADGELFVLADGHHFVDGVTLGDLYDAGGDFTADVDTSHIGTVSNYALIALQEALKERDTPSDSDAAPARGV